MNQDGWKIVVWLALFCGGVCPIGAAEGQSRPPARRALFFDDEFVTESHNLTRCMHQPQKRGAVLRPDRSISEEWIQIRSAPAWIPAEGRYYMAFLSRRTGPCDSLVAYSRDGLHWERPQLDRPGIDLTNRVVVENPLPRFNETSNIVFDPDDMDPARRFKALVGAEGRLPAAGADGVSFRLLNERVINSSDESQLLYDRARRRFVATLKVSNPFGRAVGLATSEDFAN
ncbi:MAG: hypothetical protein ABUL64_02195, partial [Singulisphaera sp.]